MKAIIMAGGEGSRLRPLTCKRPKPMVNILDKPVMFYSIDLLKKHNITDIGVTLQYMPETIQNYFGNGENFGVNLNYFTETIPLGTAGSVKNTGNFLDDTFLVISGDALTDIDLSKAIEFHKQKNAVATLVLSKSKTPLEYGVVVTDSNGLITRFIEKPSWSEVFSDTVNTGIYILEPSVLSLIPENEKFDFSKDVFPALMKKGQILAGYISDRYWCDIGDTLAYLKCHYDVLDKKVEINIDAKEVSPGIYISDSANVSNNTKLNPPVYIGSGSVIHDHAIIEDHSVIGKNTKVFEQTSIKKSVLTNNCIISNKTQLRGCIISDGANIKTGCSIYEQSVIGDNTVIGEHATVKPSIKIWPEKAVEDGAMVNMNMVWGTKYSKSLFGKNGISGEINVDITPEFASRLGASFGATLQQNSRIALSKSDHPASNMLYNSLLSGLLSAGIEIYDFGITLLPVTRSAIRFYRLNGGVHINASADEDTFRIYISFLNEMGGDINRSQERTIENIFEREDFLRVEGGEIKNIVSLHNYRHFYIRDLISQARHTPLNSKVLVNVNSHIAETIFRQISSDLGINLSICNYNTTRTPDKSLQSIIRTVKEGDFELGAIADPFCEKLILIDENGQVIDDNMMWVLTSLISFKNENGATVAVPISAPSVIEDIANENKGSVIRTKTAASDVMQQILKYGGNNQFILNFDAIGALIKILEYMKEHSISLSSIVNTIPNYHIKEREVDCHQDNKGMVMRIIAQQTDNSKLELTDGVKISSDKGWVLILPDARRAVCKIVAESFNEEYADELALIYAEKVHDLQKNDDK